MNSQHKVVLVTLSRPLVNACLMEWWEGKELRKTLGREYFSQQQICAGDTLAGLASDTPASALGQFLQRLCLVRASPSQLLPPASNSLGA